MEGRLSFEVIARTVDRAHTTPLARDPQRVHNGAESSGGPASRAAHTATARERRVLRTSMRGAEADHSTDGGIAQHAVEHASASENAPLPKKRPTKRMPPVAELAAGAAPAG